MSFASSFAETNSVTWIIDELKNIGCDTAKSVLNISVDDLVQRTDLEEETIKEVVRILKSEFE